MSNVTYVCRSCGGLRRRPKVYAHPYEENEVPTCCGEEMTGFTKVWAEAATKLDDHGRVQWLRKGAHVYERLGRRWTPALTDGEVRRAREQWPPYNLRRRGQAG